MLVCSHPLKLLCLLATTALSLCLGFFAFDSDMAVKVVKHGGYWLMLTTCVLLLFNLWERGRASWGAGLADWKPWRLPAVFVLLVSALLLQMQPSGYKITMDEPVLAATALQMHHEKQVMTAARGYEINGSFVLLGGYVDKRPFFFPFLVSVLHDLTGYRALQGVVLNALLTPIFIGLLFVAGRLFWRDWGGYLAVALFATVPLLPMNMTGAGFDLLNLVMILATGLAGYTWLKQPDTLRMNTLILLGLLLAQTRYESVLYVFAVGVVILLGWWSVKRIEMTWAGVLAPLLLISFPLQQIIFNEYPAFWQLDEGVTAPFSLGFIPSNMIHALNFFFTINREQPSSLFLSILFVGALLIAFWLLLARRLTSCLVEPGAIIALAFGSVALTNVALLLGYHWGQVDDIIATRIILPFILFQVLFVVWSFRYAGDGRRPAFVLSVSALLFFAFVTLPLCARSDFMMWGVHRDSCRQLQAWTKERKAESPLFIAVQHIAVIGEQVSALTMRYSIGEKSQIALHDYLRSFGSIYFTYQEKLSEGGASGVEELLAKHFDLELVEEVQLTKDTRYRLMRLRQVRGVDLDAALVEFGLGHGKMEPDAGAEVFSLSLP